MKKNNATFFILLFLSCYTSTALAQVTGQVTGAGKPLAGATVSLLHVKDSSLVKVTVTGTDGKFELENTPPGNYFISVSNTGFKLYYTGSFLLDQKNTPLLIPLIKMESTMAGTLSTVTVTAKKPIIERRADRTIVNVDALLSSAGSNALEVLEKSPGVQVDNNDAISLKGKAGVTIYIDDKPTYLSGADLANYLKSLPASALDKIEIMTTPPAKYDAAGNAGIINIKMKKSKIKGFNGNISTSYRQGFYGDSRNSFNFNYRKNKINLFANIAVSGGNNFNDLTIIRNYTKPDGTPESAFTQTSYIKRWYNSMNTKVGLDYSPRKKTTIGIVFNTSIRPSTERRNNLGTFFNAQQSPDSIITAANYEKEKFKNNSVNLNYRYQFDSLGKELSMDMDYIRYTTTSNQLFKNASFNADNTSKTKDDLIGSLPSKLDIYSYKADYTHPLKKGAKIETGLKASYITTDNIAQYFTTVNNITSPDYDKTNHFVYKENINAAYLNFNIEMKRLSVQIGLRLENTISRGHQLGNLMKPDSSFKKNYINLFPTVFLSYKLDSAGNNQLNFSYSKRIDRPYYADLNPFISPLDKFTYYAGNPFLKPQFTQHFELSHAYKSVLNTSLFYDRVTDEMDETIELSGNTFISRTGNIGKKDVAGFSIDATVKPVKWLTMLPYVQYLYLHTQSRIYTEEVNTRSSFWTVNLTNQINFTKGWSMEILERYRSSILDGQFNVVATGQINISAQKKILKDKGSLKINFIDIFRNRNNSGEINSLKGGSGYYHNLGDFRAVVLAFSYRFSKGTKNNQQVRKSGAESEQNRVKE
jgi:hypothetical protein